MEGYMYMAHAISMYSQISNNLKYHQQHKQTPNRYFESFKTKDP